MLFTICEIHFEIALLNFLEQSGIAPICVADRAVWTPSLSATKIVSGRHVSAKREHGLPDFLEINYIHSKFRKLIIPLCAYANSIGNCQGFFL